MQLFVFLISVTLVGVFLIAAIAKFNRPDDLHELLSAVGLSARASARLGKALPWIELATVVLLVWPDASLIGGIVAMLLLGASTAVICINLLKGRRPACNCFGQLSSGSIGWNSVARNAILLALAAVMVVELSQSSTHGLGSSLAAWARDMGWAELAIGVLALIVLGNIWLSFHLLRQNGRLLLLVDNLQLVLDANGLGTPVAAVQPVTGLPAGSLAPPFSLARLDGGSASLHGMRQSGRPIVLIFSDPACGPCAQLMPSINQWTAAYADTLQIFVVSRGSPQDNAKKVEGLPKVAVLLQGDREVAEQYKVVATPSAVMIDGNGLVAGPLAMGSKDIEAMVVGAGIVRPETRTTLRVGRPTEA